VLTGLQDFLRATAVKKVAGLTDEQAFAAPVAPSELTPAGVVKHLAGVERFWFTIDFAAPTCPGRGSTTIRMATSFCWPGTR